ELKPQLQQQPLFQDARLHVGMTDCSEIDRVELSELSSTSGRQCFARLQVALPTPIERRSFVSELLKLRNRRQDFQGFRCDLWPCAIAANHCNLQAFGHC